MYFVILLFKESALAVVEELLQPLNAVNHIEQNLIYMLTKSVNRTNC